jgi:hypothetical protein
MEDLTLKQVGFKIIVLSVFILAGLILSQNAFAALPVLNFSDIDSGPNTGNTDGLGSGAIVTIWGNNLGTSQGSSRVYVGGVEAAYIYYWKNADGTLPGGPADLKTYHRMQEIAFSVPSAAPSGATTIRVTVNGVDSNTLPFTVRSGNIRFIKSGGSNSNAGTWSSPWGVLGATGGQGVFDGTSVTLAAGDIVYSIGVGTTHGVSIGRNSPVIGTLASPISLIAYPNSTVAIDYTSADGGNVMGVIDNWYPSNRNNRYVNFSKLKVTATQPTGNTADVTNGIEANTGTRVVGLEITGPTVYGGYGGAVTSPGGIHGSGGKYYGLYIHNYGTAYGSSTGVGDHTNTYVYNMDDGTWTSPSGCGYAPCSGGAEKTSVDRFQHLFYISNRSGARVDAYEIAWCHLTENPILEGIHIYDMGAGDGGWIGTLKVHHNAIKNQRGPAIEGSYPDNTPMQVYNNLIINDTGSPNPGAALSFFFSGNLELYNNTAYGFRYGNMIQNSGTQSVINNIFVSTFTLNSVPVQFYGSQTPAPTTSGNNLYYSTNGVTKPSWDTGSITGNPLFTNASTGDFTLQSSSPAKNTGSDSTLSVAPTDLFGQPRQAGSVSIGAIEYDSGGTLPDTTPPAAPTGMRVQ